MSQDDPNEFLTRLKQFEGRALGEPFVARDAVNAAMIRHWCDAMSDANPVYTDPAAAEGSVHGGVVAPPTMLQAWTMRGLKPPPTKGPDVQKELWSVFDSRGYTSIVAVNCDQEYARYLRPGDLLTHSVVIESISEEKKTALGQGHFISQLHTFRDQSGETVGTMRFRLFRFRPPTKDGAKDGGKESAKEAAKEAAKVGGAEPAKAAGGAQDAPRDAAGKPAPGGRPPRPRPGITRDTEHFWSALKEGKLLIQKCRSCGRLRHPPEPMCPHCNALEWDAIESKGHGTVYSFVVMHYPPIPAFEYPNPIALIELDEGVRIVSNVVGVPKEEIAIGMEVQCEFVAFDDDLTLHQFRPIGR